MSLSNLLENFNYYLPNDFFTNFTFYLPNDFFTNQNVKFYLPYTLWSNTQIERYKNDLIKDIVTLRRDLTLIGKEMIETPTSENIKVYNDVRDMIIKKEHKLRDLELYLEENQ